jgi:hypothetical protein
MVVSQTLLFDRFELQKPRDAHVTVQHNVQQVSRSPICDIIPPNGPSGAHIAQLTPLLPPQCLLYEVPSTSVGLKTVVRGRQMIGDILKGADHKL